MDNRLDLLEKLKCPFCQYEATKAWNLISHFNTVHSHILRYALCPICNREFRELKGLITHVCAKIQHGCEKHLLLYYFLPSRKSSLKRRAYKLLAQNNIKIQL